MSQRMFSWSNKKNISTFRLKKKKQKKKKKKKKKTNTLFGAMISWGGGWEGSVRNYEAAIGNCVFLVLVLCLRSLFSSAVIQKVFESNKFNPSHLPHPLLYTFIRFRFRHLK